jgi:dihydroflavonol-4-reductase
MILVTGGTGLVGAHLLYELCLAGKTPRALYRAPNSLNGVKSLFKSKSDIFESLFAQIEWTQGDILDLETLKFAFADVTELYHCAALISFDPKDYKKLQQINVAGTANTVNCALDFKVAKMCYVSSIASLGKTTAPHSINEDTDWNIENPNVYALSKYQAELEVWRGIQEGLQAVIINPGVILGAGFWNKGSGKLFGFAKKGSAYYFPGGSGFVGVSDVVKLMQLGMESKNANQRYICVSENLSYLEVFSFMSKSFGTQKPTKKLSFLFLEILWRLDYIKQKITGGPRKITAQTVFSLRHQDFYSAQKSIDMLKMEYQKIDKIILDCCNAYVN